MKKEYKYFSVVEPKKEFNKDEFFSQEFIWMSESFKELVFSGIKDIITPIDYNLIPLTLKQTLSDSEARKDLGEDEVVTPHQWAQEFCFPLHSQRNGNEGILLANGYGNIRYVRLVDGTILAVDVSWYAPDRQWDCYTWELGDHVCSDDNRFFVRS